MRVLQVRVVDRPIQRVALGLRRLGGGLMDLLAVQLAQLRLRRGLVAVGGAADSLLQLTDRLAVPVHWRARFRPLPVRRGGLDDGSAFGGEITPGMRAFLTIVPPVEHGLEGSGSGAVRCISCGPRAGQFVVPDLVGRPAALKEQRLAGMSVYGANTPCGSRTWCAAELLSISSLMTAQTPSPNTTPLGTRRQPPGRRHARHSAASA